MPLFYLGGCYTQLTYRDSYDYQNQNNYNDTTTQSYSGTNSEFLTPVCNVVEEPVVDLSGVGVTYNPYNQVNNQTKTRTDQNNSVKSGNRPDSGSSTDTRNRVNSTQRNTPTNTTGTTSQPARTRDNGQSSPPNREKSRK